MSFYNSEELMPIIEYLSKKYTSGDSTSISYETAQQLMEAVLYCINETDGENVTALQSNITPMDVYKAGYQYVLEKTKHAQEKYNKLMEYFCDYNNIMLAETVKNAILGFFKYYDPLYNPQNTIITMDYPILNFDITLKGIDAIDAYLDAIIIEQDYLRKFSYEYVCKILNKSIDEYKDQIINVANIINRHVVACLLLNRDLSDVTDEANNSYIELFKFVQGIEKHELIERLKEQQLFIINTQYNKNEKLNSYFLNDIEDFAVRLKCVKDYRDISNIVVF